MHTSKLLTLILFIHFYHLLLSQIPVFCWGYEGEYKGKVDEMDVFES